MDENVLTQSGFNPTVEETETLENYLAEMPRLHILMDADQEEIERLRADNRDLKAETRAMLTTLKAMVLT